jgi:hypothetical protein
VAFRRNMRLHHEKDCRSRRRGDDGRHIEVALT